MSLRERPVRLAHPVEAGALDPPGRAQAAGDGARQEGPEALPQPRAGRVLGGGDADVVAAVVLDEEVAVAGLGEGDAAEPALELARLWPSSWAVLIAIPPTTPIVSARPRLSSDREVAARPEPAGEDQAGVLDRDEDVGAPAVVAVLLEPLEDAVGRVGRVHPDRRCRGAGRRRRRGAGRRTRSRSKPVTSTEPQAMNGAQRDDQAEQPGVALGVAPGRRVELDVLAVVMVVIVLVRVGVSPPCALLLVKSSADVPVVYTVAHFVNRRNIGWPSVAGAIPMR